MTNLDLARYYIRQLKSIRPTCDRCLYEHLSHRPRGDEWEELPWRNTWVRRCRECNRAYQHPWAFELNPVRVAEFITQDPRFTGNEITDLTALRETIVYGD